MVKILLDCRRHPVGFWETEDGLFLSACRSQADAFIPGISWLEPRISTKGSAKKWGFPYRDPWLRRFFAFFGWASEFGPFIQKEKPALCIAVGGVPETGTNIPCVSWLAGSFDQELLSGRMIYTRAAWKNLARCSGILVGSAAAEQFLADQLPAQKGRIRRVAPFAAGIHRPLDPVERQAIRNRYAEGRDYFLASLDLGGVADLLALLQAFAVFKKWQRSNMAMVLLNVPRTVLEEFGQKKDSFRYRENLKWIGELAAADRSRLLASAYALLMPSPGSNALLTLAAFSCGVPVLAASVPGQADLWEGAVLRSKIRDPEHLAGQMITLYKDESLRKTLIDQGYEEQKRCSPVQSCSQFLAQLSEALNLPVEMTIHGTFAAKT